MTVPPCFDCPDVGCGKHQACEAYMDYYHAQREANKKRQKKYLVGGYTLDSVERIRRIRRISRRT